MKFRFCVLGLGFSILLALAHPVLGQSSATQPVPQEDSSYIDAQGTAHITRVVEVPQTISPEAQKALAKEGNPPASHDTPPKMPQPTQVRQMSSDATRELYPVNIAFSTIAEIPVSIVTPLVTPADKANRVLINLHGGGFTSDSGSLTESIPVANLTHELSNPRVYKYVDGVAWHSYAGTPDAMSRVHDVFPEKNMYFTEGGPPAHLFGPAGQQQFARPPYGTDWARWSSAFTDMLRNWARMICVWNLLLDENGRPDLTNPPRPMRQAGLVSVNSKSQQLTYSGNYYAFPHYSKLIHRGARIFASSGDFPGIEHVAAKNTDGSSVLVVTNSGVEQQVQCTLGTRALKLVLAPDSITSFVW